MRTFVTPLTLAALLAGSCLANNAPVYYNTKTKNVVTPSGLSSSNLLGTAAARGLPNHIWISVRTDGKPGSGTAEDPFNAGGANPAAQAAAFDAIMANYSGVNGLCVFLTAGTFYTNGGAGQGGNGWYAADGWNIEGAGRGDTTLSQNRIIDNTGGSAGANGVIVGGDNCRVANLTIYCNWSALHTAHSGYLHSSNFGIQLKSGIIQNVHVTGGGGTGDVEVFHVGFSSQSGPAQVTCDHVTVDQVEGPTNNTCMWANATFGGLAIFRDCVVDEYSTSGGGVGYQINGFNNGLIDGCTARMYTGVGIYHDTLVITNQVYSHNFISYESGGQAITLAGSYVTDGVLIEGNTFVSRSDNLPAINIQQATNARIKNNLFLSAHARTDGVTNGTTTFTSSSANFTATDVGKEITSSGNIPTGTTIASFTNSTTVVLSAAATTSGSGKTFVIIGRTSSSESPFWFPIQTNSDATTTDIEGNRFNAVTYSSTPTLVGRFRNNRALDGSAISNIADNVSGHNIQAVASGSTNYSMTASDALVHPTGIGATDPTLTIDQAGTYLLLGRANLEYVGATYAANQTATVHLRRTNNTAANIANATTTNELRVLTTTTDSAGAMPMPQVVYTTANNNDVISVYGSVSATPSAGSVQVTEASILAVRLF